MIMIIFFVPEGFINALALEYGNACNGVLRTTDRELVLRRDCFTGQPI